MALKKAAGKKAAGKKPASGKKDKEVAKKAAGPAALRKRETKYRAVRSSIENKSITKFSEIFDIISLTPTADDIGIHYDGMKSRVAHPGNFTLDELIRLSAKLGIHVTILIDLVLNDIKYTCTPQE